MNYTLNNSNGSMSCCFEPASELVEWVCSHLSYGFLFGSRHYGMATPDSDWDWFFDTSSIPHNIDTPPFGPKHVTNFAIITENGDRLNFVFGSTLTATIYRMASYMMKLFVKTQPDIDLNSKAVRMALFEGFKHAAYNHLQGL